jgi:hypothetical protein
MDPSKEFVDGGMMPEPITEAQQKAARQLAVVYKEHWGRTALRLCTTS